MNLRYLLGCLLSAPVAYAGTLGSDIPSISTLRPAITLFGGIADIDTNHTQTVIGTDSQQFIYKNQGGTNDTTFIGGFIGLVSELPLYPVFTQTGVEYLAFTATRVQGLHTVGVEPQTSTFYTYTYGIQTQQVLAATRIYTAPSILNLQYHAFLPYIFVGFGVAVNQASQYITSTQDAGSVNLTPRFDDKTRTNFSYSVGVGVDTRIDKHVRFGLGYRFSDFGQVAFQNGLITVNGAAQATGFTLNLPHVYANQFLAQVTYTI